MKKMKFFALMAVAAVALSCTNEPEPIVLGQKVKLNLSAESVSRVWVDSANSPEGYYDFKLHGDEKLAISYNGGTLQNVTLAGETSATIEVTDDGSGNHSFLVMSEWNKTADGNGVSTYTGGLARITIPYIQTPANVDGQKTPNRFATVLYGITEPTTSLPEELNVTLRHATAYGKLDVTNFALAHDETLQQVQIVADKAISGTYDFNPTTGEWTATKARKVINVKTTDLDEIWFACLPGEALATLEVHLQTSKCIYRKEITFSSTNPLQFKAGEVSRFKVDMANALSQVVTEDADAFNPGADDKYFIVISSETGAILYPSGDFVVRNSTCTSNPRAFQFPTISEQGVDNFLWKIVKNADGTFSFISLDPANYTDPENPVIEYLFQCKGEAQGFCVQTEKNKTLGAKDDPADGNEYVNTFRLYRNTDEKYPDSFYMTSTNNIDADGNGTRWTCPYFFSNGNSRYISMRCATGKDTNKYRVRFLKYTEGKTTWNDYWTLPGGDTEADYMIIFDCWKEGVEALGAMSHEVVSNKMTLDLFETGSANGLESFTRPTTYGMFSQGTLTTNEKFDASKYTWKIKRDTSNPGTYFIYYKDEEGTHYLTQYQQGTNLMLDKSNYTKNFKFVSFIYDHQETLGIVVDRTVDGVYDGTFRYMGAYVNGSAYDVRSHSAQKSVYSNIFLYKVE
ncbi:MAG: hypothetical protein IKL67_02295 [Tidjanibacter sp.]|nr:hypothetical protein [Tidjanibacter sp.]